MSAFVLFFLWLAALRRGRFTVREFGMTIIVWLHDRLERAQSLGPGGVKNYHAWLDWAEWAARRADPAAARRLIRPEPRDVHGLARRMAACIRVLVGAPKRAPRARLELPGARASARISAIPRRLKRALPVALRARAPP